MFYFSFKLQNRYLQQIFRCSAIVDVFNPVTVSFLYRASLSNIVFQFSIFSILKQTRHTRVEAIFNETR